MVCTRSIFPALHTGETRRSWATDGAVTPPIWLSDSSTLRSKAFPSFLVLILTAYNLSEAYPITLCRTAGDFAFYLISS